MTKRRPAPKRPATKRRPARASKPPRRAARTPATLRAGALEVQELDSLRRKLERVSQGPRTPRWNADPDEVRRSVVKLVLTLVEFIRQLLERQAIRRVEAGTLTDRETEDVGLALMRLEETIRELGVQFGIAPEDLNLDLGPIGRLV